MLVSPLRYPGGKAKLFSFFADLIRHNALAAHCYCEPYAGGGGLALRLLSAGLVDRVELNDLDEAIWAFWFSALNMNRDLRHLIEGATLTIKEWYRQREIWCEKDISDPLKLGFAAFYLNRTNRSGIIEGAGPIGGYHQSGVWRLDARYNREKLAAAIASLQPFQSRIEITREDALHFVQGTLRRADTLTYLDPPYYIKGSKLYRNAYEHDDHAAMRDLVTRFRDGKWVVSYDAVPQIFDLYTEFDPVLYSLNYSAGAVGMGREVIYLSDALAMPEIDGFARVAA